MYIVSFYSFKGGVGRTMALANVGARLAQTGRKVLMVDFDLEAPGLSTYDFPKPDTKTPGIVEFINAYLKTNQAPNVTDYLYHSPGFGKKGGDLWIMPAGEQDEEYARRFAQIDWQNLYKKRDGFLLLEDLKAQWKKELQPDYILIDSRTGHSDVVGICTRQLPNAVVLMMFPNAQNLLGLRKVVADIRSHDELPKNKKTKLHFVVSNVPDLDDENQILANTLEQFSEQLGYEEPCTIIHRYQSLALLNQDIFAVTRPRTRLALEYFDLVNEIVKYNDEDKEGALSFLNTTLKSSRFHEIDLGAAELQKRIDNIEEKHSEDKDILFLLAQVSDRSGNDEQALELYQTAHNQGLKIAPLFVSMARLQHGIDDDEGAANSIRQLLKLDNASYFELNIAAQILSRVAPEELESIATSPALLSMNADDQLQVANKLSSIKNAFGVSEAIIQRIRSESRDTEAPDPGSSLTLALGQISEHRFDEALAELAKLPADDQDWLPMIVFNRGMALWGRDGKPDAKIFQSLIDVENTESKDVNYLECLAISYFVVGDEKAAQNRLTKAQRIAKRRPRRAFSAWTYSEVSPLAFRNHLNEIGEMISGEDIVPRVFS